MILFEKNQATSAVRKFSQKSMTSFIEIISTHFFREFVIPWLIFSGGSRFIPKRFFKGTTREKEKDNIPK